MAPTCYIDGKHAGQTPLSLSLPVGMHVAELRSGTTSRRMSLSVEAGKIATQHVDFGGVAATGELQVSSEPAGAQVAIDGTLRGVTPLKVPEMAPRRTSHHGFERPDLRQSHG